MVPGNKHEMEPYSVRRARQLIREALVERSGGPNPANTTYTDVTADHIVETLLNEHLLRVG